MRFNEKLTNLRKKEGLSQEELGDKLNVTRQTISKWELGQTTPEMEKLVEISKIFNVSVDSLTTDNENVVKETIYEQKEQKEEITDKTRSRRLIIIILIGALLIVGCIGLSKLFNTTEEIDKQPTEQQESIWDKFINIFNKNLDIQEQMQEGMKENFEENSKDFKLSLFNNRLEMYSGTEAGLHVDSLLNEIITINKTEDRKVTVIYNDITTQNEEEIQNIKTSIKTSNNFQVTFEYDEEGYIKESKIERQITEFEVDVFNSPLELYSGTKQGFIAINVIDEIITINKTEERKIEVEYKKIKSQDEEQLKKIKKEIDSFASYDISYEYDEQGFINKAIIEKI